MRQNEDRTHSMMQIIKAVSTATGMSMEKIIGSERKTAAILARAAIYKIATERGYEKTDILWYLDRDRTVGYNYERNVNGHLKKNATFQTICAKAEDELERSTCRVARAKQKEATEQEIERTIVRLPKFSEYRSKLIGWVFPAEEMHREWLACRAAETYMREMCRPPGIRKQVRAQKAQESIPEEMNTMDAALYLCISPSLLRQGVKLGYLTRHTKPKDAGYWYKTEDLDNFRIYIARHKRGNK